MGEARTRKMNDPLYGVVPKKGRGIVLAGNLKVAGQVIKAKGGMDPEELRHALLYWDRIAWAQNRLIGVGGGVDEDFLAEEKILFRPPAPPLKSGTGAEILTDSMAQTFKRLDDNEPGLWTMFGGLDSPIKEALEAKEGRGLYAQLFRAIPVPDTAVPLEDILRFKEKRKAELVQLQIAIDKIYLDIVSSGDVAFAFESGKANLDARAADAIRVARENGNPFRLANWGMSFSLNSGSVAAALPSAKLGEVVGQSFGLPIVGGLLGGMMPFFGVSRSWGGSRRTSDHPFRYVASMHNELLGPRK